MYSALWRVLPGGIALKIVQVVIIAGLTIAALFEWVFPYVALTFFTEQSTLE